MLIRAYIEHKNLRSKGIRDVSYNYNHVSIFDKKKISFAIVPQSVIKKSLAFIWNFDKKIYKKPTLYKQTKSSFIYRHYVFFSI